MDLKKIVSAKNAGFRTKKVDVPEWGITVTVREPLHVDFNRYIKSTKDIANKKKLTEHEQDLLSVKAEAVLFASILINDNGDLVFNDDIDDLIKNYGPIHTRLTNEAMSLVGFKDKPIEEAEKK